jgi:hypothetical protein
MLDATENPERATLTPKPDPRRASAARYPSP